MYTQTHSCNEVVLRHRVFGKCDVLQHQSADIMHKISSTFIWHSRGPLQNFPVAKYNHRAEGPAGSGAMHSVCDAYFQSPELTDHNL